MYASPDELLSVATLDVAPYLASIETMAGAVRAFATEFSTLMGGQFKVNSSNFSKDALNGQKAASAAISANAKAALLSTKEQAIAQKAADASKLTAGKIAIDQAKEQGVIQGTANAASKSAAQTLLLSERTITQELRNQMAVRKESDRLADRAARANRASIVAGGRVTRARGRLAGEVGSNMAAVGGAGLMVAGAAAWSVADNDQAFSQMRNNTTMSDADYGKYVQASYKLAEKLGLSVNDVAASFKRAENQNFHGADAIALVTESLKGAAATGGDPEASTDALATFLADYKITDSSQFGNYANLMHMGAMQTDAKDYQEFVDNIRPLTGISSSLQIPPDQIIAAQATLGKMLPPDQAATQLKDFIARLAHPKPEAQKAIDALDALNPGVGFKQDATADGIKNLTKTINDFNIVTQGHRDLALNIIPSMRGGWGAMMLANNADTYNRFESQDNAALQGTFKPIDEQVAEYLKTPLAQIKQLEATLQETAQKMAPVIIPVLEKIAVAIGKVADFFNKMSKPEQEAVTNTLLWGSAILFGVGKLFMLTKNFLEFAKLVKDAALLSRLGSIAGAFKNIATLFAGGIEAGTLGAVIAALAGVGLTVGAGATVLGYMGKDIAKNLGDASDNVRSQNETPTQAMMLGLRKVAELKDKLHTINPKNKTWLNDLKIEEGYLAKIHAHYNGIVGLNSKGKAIPAPKSKTSPGASSKINDSLMSDYDAAMNAGNTKNNPERNKADFDVDAAETQLAIDKIRLKRNKSNPVLMRDADTQYKALLGSKGKEGLIDKDIDAQRKLREGVKPFSDAWEEIQKRILALEQKRADIQEQMTDNKVREAEFTIFGSKSFNAADLNKLGITTMSLNNMSGHHVKAISMAEKMKAWNDKKTEMSKDKARPITINLEIGGKTIDTLVKMVEDPLIQIMTHELEQSRRAAN